MRSKPTCRSLPLCRGPILLLLLLLVLLILLSPPSPVTVCVPTCPGQTAPSEEFTLSLPPFVSSWSSCFLYHFYLTPKTLLLPHMLVYAALMSHTIGLNAQLLQQVLEHCFGFQTEDLPLNVSQSAKKIYISHTLQRRFCDALESENLKNI